MPIHRQSAYCPGGIALTSATSPVVEEQNWDNLSHQRSFRLPPRLASKGRHNDRQEGHWGTMPHPLACDRRGSPGESRGFYNDGVTDVRRSTASVNSCRAGAAENAS